MKVKVKDWDSCNLHNKTGFGHWAAHIECTIVIRFRYGEMLIWFACRALRTLC